jgi:hypothetical protein
MQIGDKVRFLNETGGGVVSAFVDNKTVLIEDHDGFEIPMLITECVVIDTNDYNIPIVPKKRPEPTKPVEAKVVDEDDFLEKPITFKPKPLERRGGEKVNVCLGFTPVNLAEISRTKFDMYLVNDCNYTITFALMQQEGHALKLRHSGSVEANTKLLLETFDRTALPELERLTFQAFATKQEKPFLMKQPYHVGIRIDGTKFYKLHTFGESIFFEMPAYTVDVVKDDAPVRSMFLNAEELRDAMLPQASEQRPKQEPARQAQKNGIIEVDLHASEILETETGMSAKDILEYQMKVFHEEMQKYVKKKGTKLVFIHGKGDGVLRKNIEQALRHKYKSCLYQDASFKEYGYGATMVTIR